MIKVMTEPRLVEGQGVLKMQTPFDLIPDYKLFTPSDAKGDIMVLPDVSQ